MTAAATAQSQTSPRPVSLRGERFTVVADRPVTSTFWAHADSGQWEDDTLNFIAAHAGKGSTFVDIGGWIGPTALYASRLAKRVVALEPDPVAHRDLVANDKLNNAGIDVWNVGVDNVPGQFELYAPTGLGESITSSIASPGAEKIVVKTVSFDDISRRIDGAGHVVVKVDIEGHEYQVAQSLAAFVARHRAPLHLSLHPRAYFESRRASGSYLSAKRETYAATRELLRTLATVGRVVHSDRDAPFGNADLAKLIFLRRRAKNFSVVVIPRS